MHATKNKTAQNKCCMNFLRSAFARLDTCQHTSASLWRVSTPGTTLVAIRYSQIREMLSVNVCLHLEADFCKDPGADSFTPGALAKRRCDAHMCTVCATHVVR